MAKLDVAPPRLVHKMTFKNPNLNMMNCFEDFAAFNFTGWTKEGHIVRIQTTEYTAKVLKKQIDTKDVIQRLYHIGENIFLTLSIQGTGTIKVFKSQEEVFNCVLNYPVASLFKRLNNSKEFFVGTQDGRWISLQVREDGESGFAIGAVYEMNLNDGPLNICDQDNQCVFVGERGSQTFFLVDSNKRSIIDNIKIKGNTMEVSIWNILESNGVVLLGSINEQTIHKDTFEEFSFFNLITIVKLKKDNKLVIIQTLDLQSYHSGLILSHNLESFFSFHYGHKSLNEYLLTSEIQCKNKIVTGQQLFINAIKRLNNDFILTASVDGTLGVVKHICPQQQPKIIPLFHFDTGGVLHVDVDELGNVLCLNKRGSIQIFQAPELALKKKKQNKTKYSTENVDFIEIESVKSSKSWISLKIENEKLTQKTIYDKEILYIQTEFEDIKTELNKLWKENKDLPEKDQIEPQAFELNTDELNRRIQEEVTKDELECKKLNTELSDKRSEAIKIKELVWDSMLVKGRSLRGIDTTIIVDNYPLFPITCEEENEFIRVVSQRKIEIELEVLTQDLQYRWQYKKDATNKSPHHFPHPVQQPILNLDLESQNDKYHDETSDKSNRSGISTLRVQSEKSIDELENNYEIDIDNVDVTTLNEFEEMGFGEIAKKEIRNKKFENIINLKKNSIKGHEILRDALKDETSPKECNEDSDNCVIDGEKSLEEEQKFRFFGSSSYKLLNLNSNYLIHQFHITSRRQAFQQLILLKDLIRQLKTKFNETFDELFEFKGIVLEQILGNRERLFAVLKELGRPEEFKKTKETKFYWYPDEKPEQILPNFTSPHTLHQEELKNESTDLKNTSEKLGQDNWDFEVERDIVPPEFIGNKPEKLFSQAEYSLMKQYQTAAEEQKNRKTIRRRELEVEEVHLTKKIEDSIQIFNKKLKELYLLKLEFHKCILTEELKMINLSFHMDLYDSWFMKRDKVLQDLRVTLKVKDEAIEELVQSKIILAELKEEYEGLKSQDRILEKGFKKEFPGLNFNQLEALMKAYRKRPKGVTGISKSLKAFGRKTGDQENAKELKAKSISSALERMSNMFRGTVIKKTTNTKTSGALALSLDELDRLSNCPDSVDQESWKILCLLRRKRINLESQILYIETLIYETEAVVQNREEAAKVNEAIAEDAINTVEEWRRQRDYELINSPILIDLPLGQIKANIDPLEPINPNVILISEDLIDKLKFELKDLYELQSSATIESDTLNNSIKQLKWEKEKLALQIKRLEMTRRQIRNTKLTKAERKKLQAIQSPNMENDHLRRTPSEESLKMEEIAKAKSRYYESKIEMLDRELKKSARNKEKGANTDEFLAQRFLDIKQIYNSLISNETDEKLFKKLGFENQEALRLQRKKLTDLIKKQNVQLSHMNKEFFTFNSWPEAK
ncbi:cilia- and flagella-associated protein 43 isoform X2 [Lepeophtheirus salmonis]|nr:cilia- and flagella-associated protein 43-like [Lepeophtheirus salmonis]